MELKQSVEARLERAESANERVTALVELRYERVVEIFERALGGYSRTTATTLVADRAPWAETEQAFTRMAGDHGLMILAKTELGSLTSLSGLQKQSTLYLIGNPLVANTLFEIDMLASFYFPFRVAIFGENATGLTYIAYDLPSWTLHAFGNAVFDEIGNDLDAKLRGVVDRVRNSGAHSPTAIDVSIG